MARPTDTELRLLRPLWQAQRLSARELHDATAAATGWSFSSTRKTLERMVDKGLVIETRVHGVKTYAPAQPKLEMLARLIRQFSRDVLDASAPLPVAAFTHSRVIAEDEVERLEQLIARLESDEDAGEGR